MAVQERFALKVVLAICKLVGVDLGVAQFLLVLAACARLVARALGLRGFDCSVAANLRFLRNCSVEFVIALLNCGSLGLR